MPKFIVNLAACEVFWVPVIAPDAEAAEKWARELIAESDYPVDDQYVMLTEPYFDDDRPVEEVDDKVFACFGGDLPDEYFDRRRA